MRKKDELLEVASGDPCTGSFDLCPLFVLCLHFPLPLFLWMSQHGSLFSLCLPLLFSFFSFSKNRGDINIEQDREMHGECCTRMFYSTISTTSNIKHRHRASTTNKQTNNNVGEKPKTSQSNCRKIGSLVCEVQWPLLSLMVPTNQTHTSTHS